MNAISLFLRSLKGVQFWLLSTATAIAAVHLTLAYRVTDTSFFALSLIFWCAAASLIWQRRHQLKLESGGFSSLVAVLIISLVLTRSALMPTTNLLGVTPFLSVIGLGLLASGFKGLTQYWREAFLLFFLGVPKVVLWPVIDISAFTAKYATFILWYAGFNVYRQDFNVMLPHGGVNVNMGCSGFEGMFYLLGLAVLALLMFPVNGVKRYFVPIVAVSIAFIVNGFRVTLMAILANAQDQAALDYWHVGDGSLIFSLISVILFGFFYLFLLRQDEPPDELEEQEIVES